jgi:fluoroacetyl-CoA thioesterase
MKSTLQPGLARTTTYQTTVDMRARQLQADVFSMPSMISLMERTCTELTEPWLDEHEQTVGVHIDVRHLASTRIGQSVTMTAKIIEVEGARSVTPPRPMTKTASRSPKARSGAWSSTPGASPAGSR